MANNGYCRQECLEEPTNDAVPLRPTLCSYTPHPADWLFDGCFQKDGGMSAPCLRNALSATLAPRWDRFLPVR